MNKTQIVLRYEFLNVVRSRSFLITFFLLPLVGLIALLIVSSLQKNNQTTSMFSFLAPPANIQVMGFVDDSGIINTVPPMLAEILVSFSDAESARTAVEEGKIAGYYSIPSDYLETGKVDLFKTELNLIGGSSDNYLISALLEENLITDDPHLLNLFRMPVNLEAHYQSTAPQRDPGSSLTYFLPYTVTMLFYFLILITSSTMLTSITYEKQNRVMEILLTSMRPLEMLTGKIIALGLIGLLQTTSWTGSAFLLYRLSGRTFELPVAFELPVSILLWGILFSLLGYAIYASLMAGLGAMVPNLREGSQATLLIIFPLIIPLFFINTLIDAPNSSLSVIMSLFPFTAPVAMLSRLAATQVPFWQTVLAAVLCAVTAVLIIRSVSGLFRAQNLLSGQPFKARFFIKALLGRS